MTDRPISEHQRGFTLIELLVAVAIVAILAAIAYPSYQAYIVRSNRAAAESVLMDIAQRQQQYLLDQRSYATTTGQLNVTVPPNVSSVYAVSIAASAATPPTFTVTAQPTASNQVSDGNLTIDQSGAKTPSSKW